MTKEQLEEHFTFTTGYMGDLNAWCYIYVEYPDEGSVGPFDSREDAERHAEASWDDVEEVK